MCLRLPTRLSSEIKLLNIIQKSHLPMTTCKQIFDWHLCCLSDLQKNNQISFPHVSARSRHTILKNVTEFLPELKCTIESAHINWLPHNHLVEIQVRRFHDALFSLLTNPMLVKQENFSFPDPTSPFIPNNPLRNPESPMTELHHGTWWTKSWNHLCKSR